jgi:hypothetical protein
VTEKSKRNPDRIEMYNYLMDENLEAIDPVELFGRQPDVGRVFVLDDEEEAYVQIELDPIEEDGYIPTVCEREYNDPEVLCKGRKPRDSCEEIERCLWINGTQRKYCRKRRVRRPIDYSMYECRGKEQTECERQEGCRWRPASGSSRRPIRAHCRKI